MKMRTEQDSLGKVQVPADRYWGAQTQRSLNNFRIGNQHFPRAMIKALGLVKKAAALTNAKLGQLSVDKCHLIVQACDEVIAGQLDSNFPLPVWQSGSGTQTHMNANEVIANRAIEMAGGEIGSKHPIHPNDDVNMSQSTNDVFPTCIHIAALELLTTDLFPALTDLRKATAEKAIEFGHIIKTGRTHLMDATPLSLGQEFSGYAAQLQHCEKTLHTASTSLHSLALGGSSVGTGLNTHPRFAILASEELARLTEQPLHSAENKFASLAAHEAVVEVHSALKLLATACMKIANDIRLMASGPRCGLSELELPTNEPGSSIMPGKVNPSQCEALTMIAAQIMGNDVAISIAGSSGHFELNAFKPILAHNLFESIQLMADACWSFHKNCLVGIKAQELNIGQHLNLSLMLVTALNPIIGYDQAAKVAQKALAEGLSLRDAVIQLGVLSAEEFDKHVQPRNMANPHQG